MNKLNIEIGSLSFQIEEALNRLRINVKFCGEHTKKILITSSFPNEGKSTIAIYLWKMLAEAGFKTVLLDADLRKSVIRERHGLQYSEEDHGLDYYIAGMNEYEDIVYETNIPNAYMVPCTNRLENPSILFEDEKFRQLLDRLSEDYRYVIIDSPPLENVADAALIASMCDGSILVIRSGETSKSVIRHSKQQLEQAGSRILGAVLNRVPVSGYGYGKYYGKYSHYKKYYGEYEYGYGQKSKTKKG